MSNVYFFIGASSDVAIELIKEINDNDNESVIWAHYFSHPDEIKSIKEENGNRIIPIKCNLADREDCVSMVNSIIAEGNIPNRIVHFAAPKLEYVKFKDCSWDFCVKDMEVQVASVYIILQQLLPKMIKLASRAKVVFMLSENTVNAPAKFTIKYTMSKYALLGMMKALTSEYAGKNVNINSLSPTMIDTKLLSNIDRRMLEVSGVTDKMLMPKDVVPSILKLISAASDNMYGENVYLGMNGNE